MKVLICFAATANSARLVVSKNQWVQHLLISSRDPGKMIGLLPAQLFSTMGSFLCLLNSFILLLSLIRCHLPRHLKARKHLRPASCPYEHTLYVKTNKDGDIAIVCVYVDDLIFTGNNSKFLSEFREDMIAQFEMTDIGLMYYFLGIEVKQTNRGIFISQKKYAGDILKKFKMEACNPILIPVEERLKLVKDGSGDLVNATNFTRLVGSLRYLTATRLDIVNGLGIVSRFMNSPQQSHWQAAKRILSLREVEEQEFSCLPAE
ncbi:hypothetical protein RJ640_024698 [Escallonia rubra]|uniref:Reverse transcriptase Ty1/copia-type domain-containing protein n=1 Tax=Escallonia rubra TaxID=112253 RepID=A0AA88QRU6_9ASTE|nr:hypothetical protein RJ640_024698 [Escallonia rubra]